MIDVKSSRNLATLACHEAFHFLNACWIPLKDHYIDLVYGYELIHHFSDTDMSFHVVHKTGRLCIIIRRYLLDHLASRVKNILATVSTFCTEGGRMTPMQLSSVFVHGEIDLRLFVA